MLQTINSVRVENPGLEQSVRSCLENSTGFIQQVPKIASVELCRGPSQRVSGMQVICISFAQVLDSPCFVLQALFKVFANADDPGVRELTKYCPHPVYPCAEENRVFVRNNFVLWAWSSCEHKEAVSRVVR